MNGLQCPQQGLLWRWKQHGAPVTRVTRITMETSTLTKQGQRFLTKLTTSAAAADNLIRRFVQGSPKSVVLTTLSHLLSPSTSHPHLSSIALPVSTILSPNPFPLSFSFGIAKNMAALRKSHPSAVVHLELHHRGRARRAPPRTGPPGPVRSPNFRGHFQATVSPPRPRRFLRETRAGTLQTKIRNRLRRGPRLPRRRPPHVGIGARETQGVRVHGERAVLHGQARRGGGIGYWG